MALLKAFIFIAGKRCPHAAMPNNMSSHRLLSDKAQKPKSMLDYVPEEHRVSPASQFVEHAKEARLQRIQAEAADSAQGPEVKSFARRAWTIVTDLLLVGMAGTVTAGGYYYYKYDTKELEHMVQETKKKQENSFVGSEAWCWAMEQYLKFRRPLERKIKEYTDPTFDKLLPDMAPELRGRIKTLVLDLENTLVHREWTRANGWKIYKRPGVQDFLYQMGQYYEIVIYTDEPNVYADPIINKLDTHRVIPYRLYRQDTQYHNGGHVRDLSKLNRDLSGVLFVSANPEAWQFQPENTLKLRPWTKEPSDTLLLDLLPFLQMVATKGVRDVRDVVKAYDGEPDIPQAFKKRMHQIQEQHKRPKGLFGALANQ